MLSFYFKYFFFISLSHDLKSFSGLSNDVEDSCGNMRGGQASHRHLISWRSMVDIPIWKNQWPPLHKWFSVHNVSTPTAKIRQRN